MKVIAGNWKMNKTAAETTELISAVAKKANESSNLVIACVPYTDLTAAISAADGTKLHIGAQNVHWTESGAYTGEISVKMLKEIGVEYVIIGHSERRQYFGETDETVMKRAEAAVRGGISPIICVGETLEERENGSMKKVLETQLVEGLKALSATDIQGAIIAYEPVWAIGTGKTATADEANNAIGYIRKVLGKIYGEDIAKHISILYGGSMNEKNAEELLCMPHIDGGLIGGASLVAEKFNAIIEQAERRN